MNIGDSTNVVNSAYNKELESKYSSFMKDEKKAFPIQTEVL